MKSFDWPRHYKMEEWFENQIGEAVFEVVAEHYGIEDLTELTEEQLDEVMAWAENKLPAFSLLKRGFNNLRDCWEYEQENV